MNNSNYTLLDQEFDYFIENQQDIFKKYGNKYVIIKDKQVAASFEDEITAIIESRNKFDKGTYIIQKSGPDSSVYSLNSHISTITFQVV